MTVGLVVVSHSLPLAEAAVALSRQMVPEGTVPVEIAAGVAGGFGTDANAVAGAIRAADAASDGDGVVVLLDLGSAVLSTDMALEALGNGLRERVVVCPGPFVEGIVISAVTASTGAPRDRVAQDARNACHPKESQIDR